MSKNVPQERLKTIDLTKYMKIREKVPSRHHTYRSSWDVGSLVNHPEELKKLVEKRDESLKKMKSRKASEQRDISKINFAPKLQSTYYEKSDKACRYWNKLTKTCICGPSKVSRNSSANLTIIENKHKNLLTLKCKKKAKKAQLKEFINSGRGTNSFDIQLKQRPISDRKRSDIGVLKSCHLYNSTIKEVSYKFE